MEMVKKRAIAEIGLGIALAVTFLAVSAACAGETREFRLEEARTIYPAYRTWDFVVDKPSLYAIDIVPPDAKTRPAVREWLDGVQIAFSFRGNDYSDKSDAQGRLRRFRWLETGRHTLDLYLHFHDYSWTDEMAKAMATNHIRATLTRLDGGEVGFWMGGRDPDCMARVAGEPLVVCGCAAENGAGATPRRFTMEVLRASATPRETIWSKTLAIGAKPVKFEYPCDKEGAFKYLVRDATNGEVVEGPWDFVVTEIGGGAGDARSSSGSRMSSPSSKPILIDRVNCAAEGAGGAHLFREGGKSEIVETPAGEYRLCGPNGCKTVYRRQNPDGTWTSAQKGDKGAMRRAYHDWFAYTLKVAHPGRSHALVVRVPNDVRHFTSVVAYDRRTRLSNAWSIDSGEAPAAGPWSEMKIPVWPNSDAIDVMVISTDGAGNTHIPHPNRRGAVAELSILEYPNGFPPLEEPACGWNATREFGWDGEQVNLGPNERTMPPLPESAASLVWDPKFGAALYSRGPYHDWNDLLLTWDRTFELEAWRGGTTLSYPVFSYGMVTFQGPSQMLVPVGNDVYANGCFGGGCERNPFDRDVFALMLQRAQKHGVRIFADFMVQRNYADVVAAWCAHCGMADATNGFLLVASADGKPYRPAPSVYAGMPNPAHPAARKVQIEFCREFGRRYGRYSSFGGIKHRFWKGWPASFEPWFYNAETGFDDFTVGLFSKASGIALAPVGTDEAAFAARKKRIREEYGREWSAWRTEVCRSLHAEMLAALREGAPGARFLVLSGSAAEEPDTGLDPSVFGARRDFGFDDAQTAIRGPAVEINHLDPVHFGNFWVHRPNGAKEPLPPPTGLCCNSSYRSSPYHLEPAALALADNRLDQLWAGGQWCLPPLDDALREFVRVYRTIPDRDDWRSLTNGNCRNRRQPSNDNSPVAVWWAKDGDDVLFWAVNRTDAHRRAVLRFEKEPATPLSEIELPPFMPGVFRAKGAVALVGFEVPVDPAEAAQIERDYAFLANAASSAGEPCQAIKSAVETSPGTGETYYSRAMALGRRDERWTWRDLFAPMQAAHKAGDILELRRLIADFRTNHRWWFEAFGWPDDLCVVRKVGRKTLADFLDYQRKIKPEELSFRETEGIATAAFPQSKQPFVVVPPGKSIDIKIHNSPGGLRQLEVNALFGGGYGDIRVEDWKGRLLGVIPARNFSHKDHKARKERLETRILAAPIACPNHDVYLRLSGMGESGLAIKDLGIKRLPSRPVLNWQVIGPFDKGGGERDEASYDKAFAPETEPFDKNAACTGMNGATLHWKTVALGRGERVLDVLAAAPHEVSKMNGVAYLRTVITTKRRQPTMLFYANDYYGTIWLNGKPVVPKMRGPIGKYKAVEVWLQKGENVILVKTSPGSAGTWYFGLALDMDSESRLGD